MARRVDGGGLEITGQVLRRRTMMKRKWTSASRMSVLAATLSALGALAWSGCGSSGNGSYYCDDSGCYSCDGYSCRDVPSPAPTPCTGDVSCSSGSICTDKGCTQVCAVDGDCLAGTVCKSGLCVPPGTIPGTPKGCTTTGDCTSGNVCEGGTCVPGKDSGPTCGGTQGPCACTGPSDCATGQSCVAGVCTSDANTCKYSSECGPGKVCADGQCVGDCSATTCGAGTTCVKGACQPVPTGTTCTTSATCPASTPSCVNGTCVPSCTTDAQCGTGNYCNQGACQPDTRPKPNCSGASDCLSTQQCITGYCRYTCASDDTCKLIDARIPACGADKVCRSEAEAHPQCTTKSDCAAGQSCIANVCK